MVEHGLYTIKQEFLTLVSSLGGDVDIANGAKRPVYCCIKDSKITGLFWAIPTSDIGHRTPEQIQKYSRYIALPENDLRSSYYHIAKTTKESVYKISSCYPITDKYISHEFTTHGKHVIVRRAETVRELERKLRRILAFESRRHNYFPQHITDIKNYLIDELNKITVNE